MIAKQTLELLKEGIERGLFSGAGFALISKKHRSGIGTLGRLAFDPESDRVNRDTLFDIASLTKPLATAIAVLQLADAGALSLQDSAKRYLPTAAQLDEVEIRHLLTHTSGLPAVPEGDTGHPLADALSSTLLGKPGEAYVYSDTGYILLGEIVSIAASASLEEWFDHRISAPLHLTGCRFRPDRALPIAATQEEEEFDGVVHDPRARAMGAVAGHAGLFASIDSIAAYARALLGTGKALLSTAAFESLFYNALSPSVGFQSSAFFTAGNPFLPDGIGFSDARVGHSGFTGCFLLIDRVGECAACLLTNRVLNVRSTQVEFLAWRNRWLLAASEDMGISNLR